MGRDYRSGHSGLSITTAQVPDWQAQCPCPQSIVPPSQTSVHIVSAHSGAADATTQLDG